MSNCIFCKIIAGEIPSFKIWEDQDVFVFLDIHPLRKGHCLIIPKNHHENIFDIPEELLQKIISTAKTVAEDIKKLLNATGVNILHASGKDAEQSVPHFHLHIVPRYPNDGLDMNARRETKAIKMDMNELQTLANSLSSL